MKSLKNIKYFIIGSAILLLGCSVDSNGWSKMESSENAFNLRQSENVLLYMSIETMFPDRNVRSLAYAAGRGKIKEIDRLVLQGIDVNSRGKNNATPLFWAMRDFNGFKRLLELGADPNVVFGDGGSVIHWAVLNEDGRFLKAVIEHGGDLNLAAGRFQKTPIFEVISLFGDIGSNPTLTTLLEAGADVNFVSSNGNTPTLAAASLGRFDIVYELLAYGADYTLTNDNGYDLTYFVRKKRKALNTDHELFMWLEKVTSWLRIKGVDI